MRLAIQQPPTEFLGIDELAKQYPAPYFIAVDDKRSVLHSYRVRLPTMVTVHVNQVDAVEYPCD